MGCKAQSRPPPVALRGCAVAATPLSCLWSAPLWPAVLVSPRPVAWSRASGGNPCAASVGQTWPSLAVEPVGPSTVDVVLQADTSVPRLSCAEHAPRPLGGGSGDPGPARHRGAARAHRDASFAVRSASGRSYRANVANESPRAEFGAAHARPGTYTRAAHTKQARGGIRRGGRIAKRERHSQERNTVLPTVGARNKRNKVASEGQVAQAGHVRPPGDKGPCPSPTGTEVPVSLRPQAAQRSLSPAPQKHSLRLPPFPRPCEEASRSEEATGPPRRGQPRATCRHRQLEWR